MIASTATSVAASDSSVHVIPNLAGGFPLARVVDVGLAVPEDSVNTNGMVSGGLS
jgi:hypothetical protein